jgi:replication factor A1
MNFDEMIQEILERTKLDRDELMARIKQKQDELAGFVTPEGAAIIVGRELGVELVRREPEVRQLRIEDLCPGMSNVDIVGRVVRVYEPRNFQRVDGSQGRVASLLLEDSTGRVRLVLWNEDVEPIERGEVQKGMVLQVRGAFVRKGIDQQPELNLGSRGSLVLNPSDPRVAELPQLKEVKVRVADLSPDMGDVDVVGRVVATTEPRTFERPDGSLGKVSTIVLMDSTGRARVSLWDEKAEVARSLKRGDVVKLENAYVRLGPKGKPELHLGWRGRLLLNPPGAEAEALPEVEERLLKVEEIEADMPSLDFAAKVRRKFPPQEFKRDDGSVGRVMSVALADETGIIRASFWDGMVELAESLSPGDILLVRGAYTRPGLAGRPEVHLASSARVEVNPLGLSVGDFEPSKLKLGELEPGMDGLEVVARVVEVSPPREFRRADGSKGMVATLMLGDETGTVRASLWHEQAEHARHVRAGDVVRLVNCYTTLGLYGQPELQLGKQGTLEVNPPIVEQLPPADVLEMVKTEPKRVAIGSLQKEGLRAQVRGTIVKIFHRRPIFDVCSSCGRSLGSVDTSLMCEECGKVVTPEHRVVLSLVLDDGTGNIRAVLFGRVAEKLLGMDAREVFERFRAAPDLEKLYADFKLVGREVILTGITRHDKYFDQLELRATDVQLPDSRQEARSLLEEIKA